MRFLYPSAVYPPDRGPVESMHRAAEALHSTLAESTLPSGLSGYGTDYFRTYIARLPGYLARFVHLLAWAVHTSGARPGETVLFDHGAGIGIVSMLAKQAGFARVIYNDTHEGMMRDARLLAGAHGLAAHAWCRGEFAHCARDLAGRERSRIIVSNNVIEHVYDPFALLRETGETVARPCVAAISTTANPHNPAVVLRHRRIHRRRELVGLDNPEAKKAGATAMPFLTARARIIREADHTLPAATVAVLARRTRGLRADDIASAVERYRRTGELPAPDHPTNTCDPYNGSWEERLVQPARYESALRGAGFRTRVVPGFYYGYGSRLKQLLAPSANAFISRLGPAGLVAAPYFNIIARAD